jgi:four helix bundle protein
MSEPKFRDSVAWRKAMELTAAIYSTTACFPKNEMFGLTNQLRRASVSIASNLAEGQGRLTIREFLHFLGIARGSTLEVQTQLEIALMIDIGKREQIEHAQRLAEETRRIINAAITTTRSNLNSQRPPT